jgi:hypothetical protein
MILIWLIGILLAAGILAWLTARWSAQLPRWVAPRSAYLGRQSLKRHAGVAR